jgi:hypothetical protein
MEPYIDAHSHIWTADDAPYPLARGFTVADVKPRSFTAEVLLAHCRPSDEGRVNLIQMSCYDVDDSLHFRVTTWLHYRDPVMTERPHSEW